MTVLSKLISQLKEDNNKDSELKTGATIYGLKPKAEINGGGVGSRYKKVKKDDGKSLNKKSGKSNIIAVTKVDSTDKSKCESTKLSYVLTDLD
jgi:hypothetical protein